MAITFDDVALAAEEIKQAGDNPTIERIRLQLGSRGSNSTISKHLYVWRQSNSFLHAENKEDAPNVVQAAVESAWHQLREKADAEIKTIRAQAEEQITRIEKQAQEVMNELQLQGQQYRELQETYNAVLAEKELLMLDFRKLTEDYRNLEERHHGMNERYTDMKSMTEQQLKLSNEAHQKELCRVEQILVELRNAHSKTIDEMKEQQELERHEKMMQIDHLKTDYQKQEKHMVELGSMNADNVEKVARLTAELEASLKVNDTLKETMAKQASEWQTLGEKTLHSGEVAAKLAELLTLGNTIKQWNGGFEAQFSMFRKELKRQLKAIEVQYELA